MPTIKELADGKELPIKIRHKDWAGDCFFVLEARLSNGEYAGVNSVGEASLPHDSDDWVLYQEPQVRRLWRSDGGVLIFSTKEELRHQRGGFSSNYCEDLGTLQEFLDKDKGK